jgi:hypothetical protein
MKGRPWTKVLVLMAAASAFLHPAQLRAGLSVHGGLTHEHLAQPGAEYEGVVTLVNTGETRQDVVVYQTDYTFGCDGAYYYDDVGGNPRSNGPWISFGPRLLTLAPGSETNIGYAVSVPADQDLAGTYWSILMVETAQPGGKTAGRTGADPHIFGINQIVRYGVQIVTHIGDTGLRDLEFLDERLVRTDGRCALEVDMGNSGERWLRPLVWAEIYDDNGDFVGRFEGGRHRMYPDTSVRCAVDLTEIPGGEYTAVVIADCDDDYVFGASYHLIFEHENGLTVR